MDRCVEEVKRSPCCFSPVVGFNLHDNFLNHMLNPDVSSSSGKFVPFGSVSLAGALKPLEILYIYILIMSEAENESYLAER